MLIKDFCNDSEIMLKLVSKDHNILAYASDKLRNDHIFMNLAIKINGNSIKYVHNPLNIERSTVMLAVCTSGAFEHIPEIFKNDEDVIYEALMHINNRCTKSKYILNLKYIICYIKKSTLLNDRLFVKRIVNIYPEFLYITKQFNSDKEIVKIAVNKCGYVIKYASDELKANKEIVLVAINNKVSAINFASLELQNDKDCILKVLEKKLKADPKIKKVNSNFIQIIEKQYRSNRTFGLIAVRQNGYLIRHLKSKIKYDITVMIAAAAQDINSIRCFSKRFNKENVKDMYINVHNFILFSLIFNNSTTLLYKLNSHNKYHAQKFKNLIRDFVGIVVQDKEELFELDKVYKSLYLKYKS
jgi:hypothetical protein